MTKKKRPERRLVVVSRRKVPDQDGLARLVAAMVLHQIHERKAAATSPNRNTSSGTSAR